MAWRTYRLGKVRRLVAAARFAEAELLLAKHLARHPQDFDFRLERAFCAHNAGRYVEALALWDDMRSHWPTFAMAWAGAAANARELDRLGEAHGFIEEALRRFPEDLIVLSEAIRIYDTLGQPARVLVLSGEMVRLDPHQINWRMDHLDRLMEASRCDEARDLLEGAPERDPTDLAFCYARLALRLGTPAEADRLLHAYAPFQGADGHRLAEMRRIALQLRLNHPEESLVIWLHLKRLAPDDACVQHHHVDALIRCGRYGQAEDAVRAALATHPADDDLLLDGAVIASKLERWDEAVRGLEDLIRRRPENKDARDWLSSVRMARAQADAEAGDGEAAFAAERQDVGLVEDEALRQLLLGFESLGQDCELGLVQRRYGAEPLGLFRWNFTKPDLLRQAMDTGLAGVGDPAHTFMSLWANDEYHLSDKRWGFAFHTWISRHEADRDELYRKMCRRVAFLRNKLLADITSGQKIFVLKTFDTTLESVRALFASLRAHGPVRLLWVRALAMDPSLAALGPKGKVTEIEPGLFAGCVSAFGNRRHGPWQIVFADWIDLCRSMVALERTGPSAQDATAGVADATADMLEPR